MTTGVSELVAPACIVARPGDSFGIKQRSPAWPFGEDVERELLRLTLDLFGSCYEPRFERALGQFPSRVRDDVRHLVLVERAPRGQPPARFVATLEAAQFAAVANSVFEAERAGAFDFAKGYWNRVESKTCDAATIRPSSTARPELGDLSGPARDLARGGLVTARAARDSRETELQCEAILMSLPAARRAAVSLYSFCFAVGTDEWTALRPALAILWSSSAEPVPSLVEVNAGGSPASAPTATDAAVVRSTAIELPAALPPSAGELDAGDVDRLGRIEARLQALELAIERQGEAHDRLEDLLRRFIGQGGRA